MAGHFDLLAPLYDRLMRRRDAQRLGELLRLPTEGWLLDVGGGTGRVSWGLRPLVGRLVVADFSRPMLDQARAKGDLWPVWARAEQLPFREGTFARVLVVDALHHFGDALLSLGELTRVLGPGGRLVIEEPDIARFGARLIALGERLALMGSHFLPPEEIRQMLEAQGLAARIVRLGGLSAWVVGDKGEPRRVDSQL
jgi:demethylmenaquinone methyltransferase/2-methoxy-6-polyprenyl-1,4-benzoquinol methylase